MHSGGRGCGQLTRSGCLRLRRQTPAWLLLSHATLALLLAATVARPAGAQLDSTCMVSALNRTAPVDGQGSFVLPNVPANQGLVRVRATCVAPDGSVR